MYFLEDEDQLSQEEEETIQMNGFSSELPEPFIVVPGDEEEFIENSIHPIEHEDRTDYSTLLNYNIKLQKTGKSASNGESRPMKQEPSISKLTDHNYNSVVEHAFANTLFYRKNSP